MELSLLSYPFRLLEFRLERTDRFYLPLPKMSGAQMHFLASSLSDRGFSVTVGGRKQIRAEGFGARLVVDGSGLAWSSSSLKDALAPLIPGLLRHPKEVADENPYLIIRGSGTHYTALFKPRMERWSLWTALRQEHRTGLTPDEAIVLKKLYVASDGPIECVTDYPTDGARVFRVGSRSYFHARIDAAEAMPNLDFISRPQAAKNCYLPRSVVLKISEPPEFSAEDVDSLGEWCYSEPPLSD